MLAGGSEVQELWLVVRWPRLASCELGDWNQAYE